MIKGKILVKPYEENIGNMNLHTEGWINIFDIIVTKKAVFLDLFTEVIYDLEEYEGDLSELVFIKRIGKGITERDFQIDILDNLNVLIVETHAVYLDLIKQDVFFIAFHRFSKEFDKGENMIFSSREKTTSSFPEKTQDHMELDKKNEELKKAEEDQDFEKAVILRDEIRIIEQKITSKQESSQNKKK